MSEQSVTLVLRGRGSLTFPGGRRFRTVQGGEPFVVDAATAATLLASDPNVSVHTPEPGDSTVQVAELVAGALASHAQAVDPDRPLADLKVAELVVLATGLGLEVPKRPTRAELVEAITAERDRIAAEEQALTADEPDAGVPAVGDQDPVPTPAAALTGDEEPTTTTDVGVLTLADLPDGARITS